MTQYSEQAAANLVKIRKTKPLIHNITNFVVMNFTANALLCAGASPVMAHAENEVEEMVALAGALVLNIGTLSDTWVASMIRAGKAAGALKIPVVLDPVGSGATTLRTRSAMEILKEMPVTVLRGNASEILSLRTGDSKTKGVDAVHSVEAVADFAPDLARELNVTLAVTGPVDRVTDGTRRVRVENGHPLMGNVTGTGCTATALIGAFLAVDPDPVSAAATALAYFGMAGERAATKTGSPGSFMIALLDALHDLSPGQLEKGCRIRED